MVLQQLVAGLATGSIYALVAMGFTLIWKSMKLVNFAQGDFFMMGAMFGYTLYAIAELPFWLAIIGGVILSSLVGVLLERLAIRPLGNAPEMSLLLVTIAAGILLQNIAKLIWGADTLPFRTFFEVQTIDIAGVSVRTQDIVIVTVTVIVTSLFHFFFQYTKFGKALRATSMDKETATAMGINVRMMMLMAISISASLGGLAGMLIAPIHFIYPTMGVLVGLKAFIAAVIGGFNHIYGALIGGLFIGVLETFAAGYMSSAYRDVIAFVVLILVLRFMPSGILGKKSVQKV